LDRDATLLAVLKNLSYLRDKWDNSIEAESVRVNSILLRFLLVDNQIQKAWKAVGLQQKQPSITAFTLDAHLQYMRSKSHAVAVGWVGGAKVRGIGQISQVLISGEYLPDEEAKEFSAITTLEETVTLQRFIEAPSVIVLNEVIPRRVVIKYVANTMGVAHVGKGSKKITDPERHQYRRLDQTMSFGNGQYPVPLFEILSIGQTLARADDMTLLCERIKQDLRRPASP
jgi:hypothetical protein